MSGLWPYAFEGLAEPRSVAALDTRIGGPGGAPTPRGLTPKEALRCETEQLALGAAVRELRARRWLSQEQLGFRGGLYRNYVGGITPSERRVAEMAASGMTNRQIAQALFLTVKTIETHLAATYDKLGIHSRRELPEALDERPNVAAAATAP